MFYWNHVGANCTFFQQPIQVHVLHPNVAGAPNIVALCSTPMTTPRTPMSAPHGHPGTHTSARARRRRGREPMGGRVRTRRKAVIPLGKRLARPMEKARGANAAGCPLYVRAGRGCDRGSAACCRSPPFHTSWHPRPLVFVLVCLCVLFAPSSLCLHGTGGCASCRDGN